AFDWSGSGARKYGKYSAAFFRSSDAIPPRYVSRAVPPLRRSDTSVQSGCGSTTKTARCAEQNAAAAPFAVELRTRPASELVAGSTGGMQSRLKRSAFASAYTPVPSSDAGTRSVSAWSPSTPELAPVLGKAVQRDGVAVVSNGSSPGLIAPSASGRAVGSVP